MRMRFVSFMFIAELYAAFSLLSSTKNLISSRTRALSKYHVSMSLRNLARKSKEAEIQKNKESLLSTDPQNVVFHYIAEGNRSSKLKKRPTHLSSVLKKASGTLSVVAEYRRNMRSGFIEKILEPELMSPMFRDGTASAVAIAVDPIYGGCSNEDVLKIIKEQSKAQNEFPSSLPVIVRDLVVDSFQIAVAKSLGAEGITILYSLVGPDKCEALIDFAGALGLESIVQVSTKNEIEQAIAAGSTILSVTGQKPDDAIKLRSHIPDNILAVVHVDRRSDEGLDEIEDCWLLRDAGYHSIWASEILYKAGQTQSENAVAIIKAIRAKASVEYGQARGMSGKGEGAREYLGTLAT